MQSVQQVPGTRTGQLGWRGGVATISIAEPHFKFKFVHVVSTPHLDQHRHTVTVDVEGKYLLTCE